MESSLHIERQNQPTSRPIFSIAQSALVQTIGFGVGYFVFEEVKDSVWLMLASHTVVTLVLSRALKLSLPWQLFNILIPIGTYGISILNLPNIYLLLIVAVLVLIYVPTFWTKVPYYPTSQPMYHAILSLLPEKKEFSFIDLGCGFGDLLLFLSRERTAARFLGAEIGPLPYLVAKTRTALTSKNRVGILFQSFWRISLSDYDFVYAFLSPEPMEKLWEKVQKEMKPGTIFLTNSFEVPSQATRILEVDDKRKTKLFVHLIS